MSEMKNGDWLCAVCQAHNFASRKQCYKCAAVPGAGSFYEKISGKPSQQAFAARDAALAVEIEQLKRTLERAKANGSASVRIPEGSFGARRWLETEGFPVAREMEKFKACYSGGIAYDSGDECDCEKCENHGKPTGRHLWIISW